MEWSRLPPLAICGRPRGYLQPGLPGGHAGFAAGFAGGGGGGFAAATGRGGGLGFATCGDGPPVGGLAPTVDGLGGPPPLSFAWSRGGSVFVRSAGRLSIWQPSLTRRIGRQRLWRWAAGSLTYRRSAGRRHWLRRHDTLAGKLP
jgi:hypothetical protein